MAKTLSTLPHPPFVSFSPHLVSAVSLPAAVAVTTHAAVALATCCDCDSGNYQRPAGFCGCYDDQNA